jgi:AAA domain
VAYLDPKALSTAGFTDVVEPRVAAIIVNIAGVEGTGKTHWSLTAPKPLFYMSTDFGDAGVIQKAGGGQIIRPAKGDYKLDIPHEFRAFVDREESDAVRKTREGRLANYVHDKFYVPFFNDYKAAIDAGVRTVVWDTALEVWEFVRLSVYGRAATNRDDLKTEANSKMKELIRLANVNSVNLIMVNRLKPKWESYYDQSGAVKWRMSAEWEMQGYDKSPELVALNLWTSFKAPDQFELTVKKCRDNPQFVGETFPAMPFADLMGMLIPSVESWESVVGDEE